MLKRRRIAEIMDRAGVDSADLFQSLSDLESVGRWLGGRRTSVRLTLDLARRVTERPVRILDVGTGGADVPRAVADAARRSGIEARIVATDIHPTTLEFARRHSSGYPEIAVERADALNLPYEDGAFHVVMCNTTLHHFDPDAAVRVLRQMDRVASRGIVVTDLARSRAALIGAQLLAVTVWRGHAITRHDGPASVRAAFTPTELNRLADLALDDNVRSRRRPIFRLSLVVDRASS